MKFILLTALVAVALSANTEDENRQWKLFKENNRKSYLSDEEEQRRKLIFLDNLKFVRDHNDQFSKGKVTFEVGINKLADMNTEEISATRMGLKIPNRKKSTREVFKYSNLPKYKQLPIFVNWWWMGAVTPVKDQGDCGSCWAFSTTGSLEGQHYLKTRKLVSLSEQNLIDCSWAEGNAGCDGGYMDYAFDYIKNNHGIDTEASYPYMTNNSTCRYNPNSIGATLKGYVDITEGDEMALQQAVAHVGPISVGIDAYHRPFYLYKSGIYKNPYCSNSSMNHAVLAVGYGTSMNGTEYWLMKNSWGTDWGYNGYFLIVRNDNNMCGIATMASYPVV